jgi:hypothetical protein
LLACPESPRVYEYAVEPSVLQNLPDRALLLAVRGPAAPRLQAVKCDPAIATLPRSGYTPRQPPTTSPTTSMTPGCTAQVQTTPALSDSCPLAARCPATAACTADGRWSFLLTAAPLSVVRGVGSPANAIALR